ncbi:uncharacterized protein LOC127254008 [Andrographis paniculata]|uniref:uncharacterized protein LOC127254008 n=1 Tax=Andrographis paniculata TaxID=175694 RepID=UPI0021E91041|nr:uncharacterized protein LOC127254008 [Andrographis paniculata]
MEEATAEDGAPPSLRSRSRHIKKRALKNKTLSLSFNEKDLKDFVTGFHKRKKKRRKEARQKQEEADRRKRIEMRKRRKLERDFIMNSGAPPDSGGDGAESAADDEEDDNSEPVASVAGTTMYDNGDVQVTVTTREIMPEEGPTQPEPARPQSQTEEAALEKRKQTVIPVSKKKQFKKAPKKRSRVKPQSKRDKKKGKKKNQQH